MRTTDEEHIEWQPTGRTARWYEWLLILLLLGIAGGVRAASVYKCAGAHGEVAYQSQPCPDGRQATVIEIAPAPAFAPSPRYAIDHDKTARPTRTAARRLPAERRETTLVSYECRAADGQLFYRHGSCPHSIAASHAHSASTSTHGKGAGRGSSATVAVSAQRIAREDACREIQRAGAAGRAGHEHDEVASTYERNLGRDPCR
ncbi:MAG TPA: DUF4124 domain-containing protein [Rhodanobacteraceae bacterium]|jgi:hypothetical protein|nr:DUF4124 domain-containing protein [Rhodanobacteraceae bacterium]